MTTTQHTQGPWDYDCYGEHFSFFGNDGREDYSFRIEYNEEMPEAEQLENSHLIAAAPELLSALSNLIEDHKRMFPEAHPNSTIAWEECEEVMAAFAAIAKAEGRAE